MEIIDLGNGYYRRNGKKLRKVMGVGITDGDLIHSRNANNKIIITDPFYARWSSMLRLCYSQKWLDKKPTYAGCFVCEEWLYFSNFKSWMEQQDWEGKELDKDLLVKDNKEYSPQTCVFIPQYINTFLTKRQNCRGDLPIGIYYSKERNSYVATCRDIRKGAKVYLGACSDRLKAHKLWQKHKIDTARYIVTQQTDQKIVEGLQRVINKIQHDLDNNLITESF